MPLGIENLLLELFLEFRPFQTNTRLAIYIDLDGHMMTQNDTLEKTKILNHQNFSEVLRKCSE